VTDLKAGEQLDGFTVAESHPNPPGTPGLGYWYCDHHGPLAHNMAAEQHHGKACRLAWYCFTHRQFEAP